MHFIYLFRRLMVQRTHSTEEARSKRELYKTLIAEGHYFLPPISQTPMNFLADKTYLVAVFFSYFL